MEIISISMLIKKSVNVLEKKIEQTLPIIVYVMYYEILNNNSNSFKIAFKTDSLFIAWVD